MFNGDFSDAQDVGDGITSSMNVLYDLDSTEPETENNQSWDWNSNLSSGSSNYFSSQQYYEQGMNYNENGDRSQKMLHHPDPIWSSGSAFSPIRQSYDQNVNHYNSQQYGDCYNDSSKHYGQMQPSPAYESNNNQNYGHHGGNPSWNSAFTPQPLMKGNQSPFLQHGLHQRNAQEAVGQTNSGANFKILPSKKIILGSVSRDYSQLGQRGVVASGFIRKGVIGLNQAQQPMSMLKNRLGGIGHGLIKVADGAKGGKAPTTFTFYDPPFQRQKPRVQVVPAIEYDNDRAKNSNAEKFAPMAIELLSVSTDDEDLDAKPSPSQPPPPPPPPPPPRVIEVKTVPIRNPIFGFKKLKFRCMKCGARDATANSLLTHVKSHGKPYCMHCCWIGDSTLQLKAHVEKAHPKLDTGSGVTMVTSKYGRKCQVNTSVAVGLKKRKLILKSPQVFNQARVNHPKLEPEKNYFLDIKKEPAEKIDDVDLKEDDSDTPTEQESVNVLPGPKVQSKQMTPPTRGLSKRRQAMVAKEVTKDDQVEVPKEKVTPKVEMREMPKRGLRKK